MSLVLAPIAEPLGDRRNQQGVTPDLQRVLGEAGQADAEKRSSGCARPVRLVGANQLVDQLRSVRIARARRVPARALDEYVARLMRRSAGNGAA